MALLKGNIPIRLVESRGKVPDHYGLHACSSARGPDSYRRSGSRNPLGLLCRDRGAVHSSQTCKKV